MAGRTADGRQTLSFPRRLSVDSLRYIVEVSTDLVNWTTDTTRSQHLNHGDGTATETWTANTAEDHQFMRLRVTKP